MTGGPDFDVTLGDLFRPIDGLEGFGKFSNTRGDGAIQRSSLHRQIDRQSENFRTLNKGARVLQEPKKEGGPRRTSST